MDNVVCLKWGTKYSAEYVNKLAAMVRRHLKRPHRFVCLTDDRTGIDDSIECLPILDPELTGWWHKLSFFRPEVHDLTGTTLFLDLDVVITDSLDPLFELEGEFCIIKDWAYRSKKVWNSSVFRFVIGQQTHVWTEFQTRGPDRVVKSLHGDQNFISEMIPDATVWPADWCQSFKYHCCVPRDAKPSIPAGARVLVFHGKPDPHEAVAGENRRYKAAPWIAKHWHDKDLRDHLKAPAKKPRKAKAKQPAVEAEPAVAVQEVAVVPLAPTWKDKRRQTRIDREIAVCREMLSRLDAGNAQAVSYYTDRLATLEKLREPG